MIKNSLTRTIGQIGVFVVFFALWELAVDVLHVKAVILPPPSLIFQSMPKHWFYLLQNSWPTLVAVAGGFAIAASLGFSIAVRIASFRLASQFPYPLLVPAHVLPERA